MALVELQGVAKTYYLGKGCLPVPALKDVSLKIEPGEFVAIMGPSGSGKSTLLAILGLLDKPDKGQFRLLAQDVTALKDNDHAWLRSRYLGFVFQMFNLLPRFNIVENSFLPFLYAESTKTDHDRVIGILKKIGLGDRLKHKPNELSGGQQQRVAVARALANQPLIILADEPTGNLDSKSALEIIGMLKELNAQGTTIIMVTHEADLAQAASRIITLKDGLIVADEKKAAAPGEWAARETAAASDRSLAGPLDSRFRGSDKSHVKSSPSPSMPSPSPSMPSPSPSMPSPSSVSAPSSSVSSPSSSVSSPRRRGSIPARSHKRRSITPASIWNYAYEALLSLFANKVRSLLSILGVLIGVAAVIAMLALGSGAKMSVQKSLANLGSNLLMVSTSFRSRGISLGADSVTRFTFDDLKALGQLDNVTAVVPYVNGRAQAVYQNKNWNASVVGSTPEYQTVRNSVPTSGRFFSQAEVTTRAKVAVIGQTVVDELFGQANPLGQQIKINRINFLVIGLLPVKGSTGFQNSDNQVLVPITTAMYRLFGRDYISSFDVQVDEAENMAAAQEEVTQTLARLHRLTDAQLENIDVHNMADIQATMNSVVGTFTLLLGSIAAVSLLVGGIGIMNIMLVLIMERTHEIGLRKALGAENRDILLQFLVESVLICVLGGLLGIGLGSGIAILLSTVFGWYTVIDLGSIALAFGFSVGIGVVFGLWPAWRAARLLPVEALRYE